MPLLSIARTPPNAFQNMHSTLIAALTAIALCSHLYIFFKKFAFREYRKFKIDRLAVTNH